MSCYKNWRLQLNKSKIIRCPVCGGPVGVPASVRVCQRQCAGCGARVQYRDGRVKLVRDRSLGWVNQPY